MAASAQSVDRAAPAHRLGALDVMRGLVMVLMAVDHSSEAFNAGRLFTDSSWMYKVGSPLPLAQFLTRWVTHLCAPTFVLLAGASLALYVDRRKAAGESAWAIDRHLVTRGVVIAGFELWVSLFWMPPGRYLFQVLYAIGTSFVLMVPLRRLPTAALVGLGAVIPVGGEWLTGAMEWTSPERTPLWAALLLVPGFRGRLIVAYPTLPWLSILLLGWAFGRLLTGRPADRSVERGLFAAGAVLLGLFAIVRGVNGFGNMGLPRYGGSITQWLHVSKYPPSLSFAALELGVAAIALGVLWAPAGRTDRASRPVLGPLTVFGRTPMFFYLLHIPLLTLAARALGVEGKLGLGATYGFAALVAAVLYPACRAYGRYKAARSSGWTRYV